VGGVGVGGVGGGGGGGGEGGFSPFGDFVSIKIFCRIFPFFPENKNAKIRRKKKF